MFCRTVLLTSVTLILIACTARAIKCYDCGKYCPSQLDPEKDKVTDGCNKCVIVRPKEEGRRAARYCRMRNCLEGETTENKYGIVLISHCCATDLCNSGIRKGPTVLTLTSTLSIAFFLIFPPA
ncbi:unnamed protein product [Calicophoron daubneyi]|uniref:Uncharacterized protein n=1 Tax=Calicophoron daubneyi TaxID=300641 RepID=A0AAV2TX98_CALDB